MASKDVAHILKKTALIFLCVGIISYFTIMYLVNEIIKKEQTELIDSITHVIETDLALSKEVTQSIEYLIDMQLFNSSKLIAKALEGKTIEEITVEELDDLKQDLNLYDISLFVQEGDIIYVKKSTDSHELGIRANAWGYWYTALSQLFNLEEVTVGKGLFLPNFWSGPISISAVHEDQQVKYAYYYDGTTDYMLNPYILADEIYKLHANTGPNQQIQKLLSSYQRLEEISVLNAFAYLEDREDIIEPDRDMPVLYGSNTLKLANEKEIIRHVIHNNQEQHEFFSGDGIEYKKIYMPLQNNRIMVVTLDITQDVALREKVSLIIFFVFTLSFLILLLVFYNANKRSLSLLDTEQKKLELAEDFKRTVEFLPQAIYKFRFDEQDKQPFKLTYFEGSLVEEFSQSNLERESLIEAFLEPIYPYLQRVLEEEFSLNFISQDQNRYFKHTLKPIKMTKDNQTVEIAGYAEDVTLEIERENQIKHLAFNDQLTQIPNRTSFISSVKEALQNHKIEDGKIAILFMDFNKFKNINDTLGHLAGDEFLKGVASRLHNILGQHEVLARLGGDEFAIIQKNIHVLAEIDSLVARITSSLKTPFVFDGNSFIVSASIGISVFPEDGIDYKTLLQKADIAMYSAKKGLHDYRYFSDDMYEARKQLSILENDLRHALEKNEFRLVYQPQYDVYTKQILGTEALIRWDHPIQGTIMPDGFVGLAEEIGLIKDIGYWVMDEACTQYMKWYGEGRHPKRISINISAHQLFDPNLIAIVEGILYKTNIPPSALCFEITETAAIQDMEYIIEVLNNLKGIGIKLSVDDFGKGYSSLTYLKSLPIDYIKIDRTFVKDISINQQDKALFKAIIDLAKVLKLSVIVEGIENLEQYSLIKAYGCHEMQGFLLSPPVHPQDIPILFEEPLQIG